MAYKGSFLGIFWAIVSPLVMLSIYSIAFGYFLKSAWPNSKENFTLMLFSGLIVFNLFSECLNKSSNLIVGNSNYVKKVVFPIEIMGVVLLGGALFHFLLSFIAWISLALIMNESIQLTILWVPIILLPFCLLTLGLVWIVSSLGVFLRDISQIISMLMQGLIFLSPVFFPINNLPEWAKWIVLMNPPSFIILEMRRVMVEGLSPNFLGLIIYCIFSVFIFLLGYFIVNKLKSGFADVL